MKKILLSTLLAITLVGCSEGGVLPVDYSEQKHPVNDYLIDDQLRAATLDACKAIGDKDQPRIEQKPACINVRKADGLILKPTELSEAYFQTTTKSEAETSKKP